MSDRTTQHALDVKRRHEQELMRKVNVVAVGVGFCTRGGVQTADICIVVSVQKKVPLSTLNSKDVVPTKIEDVQTDVVETGPIRAL